MSLIYKIKKSHWFFLSLHSWLILVTCHCLCLVNAHPRVTRGAPDYHSWPRLRLEELLHTKSPLPQYIFGVRQQNNMHTDTLKISEQHPFQHKDVPKYFHQRVWIHTTACCHLYAIVPTSEARELLCFCVCRATVFMLITCIKARADTEIWCSNWCWVILNESIMSRARVEQSDSPSSQRYLNFTTMSACLLKLVQTSFN